MPQEVFLPVDSTHPKVSPPGCARIGPFLDLNTLLFRAKGPRLLVGAVPCVALDFNR